MESHRSSEELRDVCVCPDDFVCLGTASGTPTRTYSKEETPNVVSVYLFNVYLQSSRFG